jgi:hypothetical protein
MGAINAEGIKNQLGRPSLDRFVVLVREAAQNSWDAADPERDGPVQFDVDLCELDETRAEAWRRLLLTDAPAAEHLPLRKTLLEPLTILFVSDRGTVGLGGPTRADEAREGERHDYISFVLNVGEPRDVEFGGGTYGFGKAVFFLASAASTILVYTRCRNGEGQPESRLVGCALGQSFESDGHAHTGRHWFGLTAESPDLVEPMIGHEADALAEDLGFPSFADGAFGTTIAVVSPELDGRDEDAISSRLVSAVLWHLWPKMVDRGDGPAMQFAVARNGSPLEIPDPSTHPALREFVSALRELDESGETITYGAGALPVGEIKLRTTFAPPPEIDEVGQEIGLEAGVHHCCLLRAPELVVEYRQGPPLPDDRIWYAGVFRVRPDRDATFAQAETPTHDAWSPESLEDRERSLVRTTLRKIDERLRSHAAPRSTEMSGGAAGGLAGMSRILGGLLAPAPGEAAGPRSSTTASGRRRGSAIQMTGAPEWRELDGRDVLVQPFEVHARRAVTIDAETSVRIWGGGEKRAESPIGAATPELIAWRDPHGELHPPGRLAIGADAGGKWEAIVVAPVDTMTRIRVHEATVDGADG